MAHRALTQVLQGHSPAVEPGELIPDKYVDAEGNQRDVDFDRLVALGAAEKVTVKQAKAIEKAVSEGEDPPPVEPPPDEPAE